MQEGFTQMAPHPLSSLIPGASYEAGGSVRKVGEYSQRGVSKGIQNYDNEEK